jgi:SPP1 gp7 family putative phage head morphogenesis protein
VNRNQTRNEFNALLDTFERRYIARVYKALKQPYKLFVNDVKTFGLFYAKEQLNSRLMSAEMGAAVEKIHTGVGVFMANRTLRELKKNIPQSKRHREKEGGVPTALSFKFFGFSDEFAREIINYFRMYLLNKAVIKVSQTTRDHILQVLEKATLQGWSNDQIVKEILESPEARIEVRNRARKIVRTESVRAANYGIQLGANKYEYEVEKEWLSIVDNRIRHSHRNVDGERRSVDGVFSNGLRFPGDPNGSPENTINCRCRLVMVALRDSQGRLIPKRSLQVI